jgi:hypothetical protein
VHPGKIHTHCRGEVFLLIYYFNLLVDWQRPRPGKARTAGKGWIAQPVEEAS